MACFRRGRFRTHAPGRAVHLPVHRHFAAAGGGVRCRCIRTRLFPLSAAIPGASVQLQQHEAFAMFSLFRCGDDAYVVVPLSMSPSIDVVRLHGEAILVRATPTGLYDSVAWAAVSQRVDADMFAVLGEGEAERLFDMR